LDKRKGILNVAVSILFKIILLAGSIIVRRLLIERLGNGINGINSLYVSIIGLLSVAELGVGGAITYCMYKPIVEGNTKRVAALFNYFKRAYFIIGIVIFLLGVLIMPALPFLAEGHNIYTSELYSSYIILLISVCASYMFGAKLSLINAHKNNYITTSLLSVGVILQYILQALVLIFTPSFDGYLLCAFVSIAVQWVGTELITRILYGDIVIDKGARLTKEEKREVKRNSSAMLMHKIGGTMVNTLDSIIISAFLGVELLGRYSNYSSIVTNATAVLSLLFTPLISIIGHTFVTDRKMVVKRYDQLYLLNFTIGVFFYLGFYAVSDSLIELLFGEGLELLRPVVFVMTVNYFIQFMRQTTLVFRDATGIFYKDRWKPIVEGSVNAVLSVLMVILFKNVYGEEMATTGVIFATVVTNLSVCHIIEPYVLFKYAFDNSPRSHYFKSYIGIGVFTVALYYMDRLLYSDKNAIMEFLLNGAISLGFSALTVAVVFIPKIITYIKNKTA